MLFDVTNPSNKAKLEQVVKPKASQPMLEAPARPSWLVAFKVGIVPNRCCPILATFLLICESILLTQYTLSLPSPLSSQACFSRTFLSLWRQPHYVLTKVFLGLFIALILAA